MKTIFRTRSARIWRSPNGNASPTAPIATPRIYAALKDFGNVTLTTEAARRVWTPAWLEALRDLRPGHPLRHPRAGEEPGVLTDRHRRPHARHRRECGRLHDAEGHGAQPARGRRGLGAARRHLCGNRHRTRSPVSYPDYRDLRDQARAFTGLFGTRVLAANLGRGRGARPVFGEVVTGNYFQVLGVRAALGRTLLPSDENAPGATRWS